MKAYALIIGIQSYNVKPLDNAVNDAEGMAQKMLSLGYFVDLFKFYKSLDDTLEERFYLKLLKMFLILGLIGFIVFMVMVFCVGVQVSEFYGIPLGRSLFETLMEIID